MSKNKLFRDPIHNYIEIRDDYCSDFIDTPIFQRLRSIEQTSMRILYPSARHDRFVHSIGVFHLAQKVFDVLKVLVKENTKNAESVEKTFLLAALLHDCAHSPFSHTGEEFTGTYCENAIGDSLITEVNSDVFKIEFDSCSAAPHELASAYIACHYFSEKLNEHKADPEQLARMIIGLTYTNPNKEQKIINGLIQLINGSVIDVDRLDYLMRDTWASGVNNTSVDVTRLINGINIDVDTGDVCIKNNALSSVINAIKARDFLFQWILPHHKVEYGRYVLKMAIEEFAGTIAKKNKIGRDEVFRKIFSPEALLVPQSIGKEIFFRPTDGDILYLLKKYCPKSEFASELSSRNGSYSPLWKTYTEFNSLFKNSSVREAIRIESLKQFADKLYEFCKTKNHILKHNYFIVTNVTPKTAISKLDNLFIEIEVAGKKQKKLLHQLIGQSMSRPERYAYVFVHNEISKRKNEFITELVEIYDGILKKLIEEDKSASKGGKHKS
jgi:HD superfamily phosphohydrolase